MTPIEFIAKHCQRSKPEESMADLQSVINHEAQKRYEEACVVLRESRMGIMLTEEEDNALRIAAGIK